MQVLLRELGQAWRVVGRAPLYSAALILTLGLGIASSSSVLTIARAALLHPLSCQEPSRLMVLDGALPCVAASGSLVGPPIEGRSLDWRSQVTAFSDLAIYSVEYGRVNVTGAGEPERVSAVEVSVGFFPTLGVNMELGRNFLDEEQQPGKNRVVIISHNEWRTRFGLDPGVLNRTIRLNAVTHAIVGVAPEGFRYPDSTDFWVPVLPGRDRLSTSPVAAYEVVGRLRPGITRAMAQSDVYAWRDRAKVESPGSWPATRQIVVSPLLDRLVGNLRESLLVVSGAVMLVLLIAFANVASLVVARIWVRRRELAVRMAMGASRWSIIRLLVLESLVVTLPGCILGVLGAWWLVTMSVNFASTQIPALRGVTVDKWGIACALVVAGLAGVTSALGAAIQSSGAFLPDSLKEGGHQSAGGPRLARFRKVLVASEIALSLLLLVGAGLLIKSLGRLQSVPLGFDPSNLLTVGVSTPSAYRLEGRQDQFFTQLTERISQMPGVLSVGATNSLPFAGTETIGILFDVDRLPPGISFPERFGLELEVTPGYFAATGIPVRRGRAFTGQDTKNAQPVVIVNECLADRYWPGESGVGKRITITPESTPREIVGVVEDTRQFDRLSDPEQQIFLPYLQTGGRLNSLAIRMSPTLASKAALVSAVRDEVHRLDPDLPVYDIKTMDQWLQESLARQRLIAFVLLVFASAAVVLAAGGVYSVVAYGVVQRTREIGIRMAVGATRRDVLSLILRQGAILGACGVAVGVLAAIPLTRLMSGLLYHVDLLDAVTYGVS
ncbi:MAG TPA: ABC transporter permease, partial [Blastocatellia bacterium]|nr:ABC transporter permease [Blastocatellia bacterium]